MKKTLASIFLRYLRICARLQLLKFRPVIVGIGGASGKTSLTSLTSLVLRHKYKVLETKGKNSETGIPLSVLRLKMENYSLAEWIKVAVLAPLRVIFDWNRFEVLVAELGIDGPNEPKNMTYLLGIVKPKIAALTNISFEHSVYFESETKEKQKILDLTVREELRLLTSLPENGLAVLNVDDPNIRGAKGIKAAKIAVSAKEMISDFFIEKTEADIKNFRVYFIHKNNKYKVNIPQPLPDHYAYTIVMAISIGVRFGFDIPEAIEIIEKEFSLPPGRITLFKGKKDTVIIDSSYNNATLSPIIDLLDLLKRVSGKRRKVAIVGDMRELGIIAQDYHKKVAAKLLETTDLVLLIGPLMKKYAAPVLSKNNHKFLSFETFSEAKKNINEIIKENDIVLVKGSQNTLFLERIVEMLLLDPRDRSKLCRRGKFWDRIRAKTA